MPASRYRSSTLIAGALGVALATGGAVLVTSTAQAAAGCRVSYTVTSSWPGGFGAGVTVTNLGDAVTGWTLTWSFGAGQTITQLWNGTATQSGAQVSVVNAAYNGAIASGGTVAFGFNGSWTGANPSPAAFVLNGVACTGEVGGTSSPSPSTSPSASPSTSPSASQSPGTGLGCTNTGTGGGSGPCPAGYETSGSLPNHTIYRPESLPAQKMPIFVWGEGGCSANGTASLPFLREIASHGFLVLASGSPNGSGSTTASMLTQSMDWAVAENSRSGSKYYGKLDTSKIAVAGWSCGGLEAYEVSNDSRVTTTMIFSSGLLDDNNDYQLRRLTRPIAYFIGGSGDIAYGNAMDDWGKLPSGLPAFMGNLNVGHGGTYTQTNGGEFGRVAVLYLKWRLRGDTTAGANFVGSTCGLCRTQWTVQQRNLTL
ncbi:cellulose binding domain-containing protein [Dactylosporangium sp. CS-047395]|uniref:cellulose binding domain-containing protein n=1 Tax=Dactylosporangium sp. CS-047395 TaxID=3239936 RepID=UPI003D8DD394